MRVSHFVCGPAANESELRAFDYLRSQLQSTAGNDSWVLLTNLAFSVNHQLQSDEIDVIAIGPPGVRVIEVKHWSTQWVDTNAHLVEQEADRVMRKARKIGTTLRKIVPRLPYVDGVILLTREPSKVKKLTKNTIRGVRFHTLNDWKEALDFGIPSVLRTQDIALLSRALEPRSAVAIDGSLRRLAGYVNLELHTPKEERFHRIYRGTHSVSQDRVVLHLYDLSASDEKNAENKARREFEALRRLQQYTWAPRILDSFHDAPGYAGEMFFFAVVDPAAPCAQERMSDESWETIDRIAFARSAIRALREMHDAGTEESPIIHRNLTSHSILVKHDNTPVLTGFELTRIPSDISVASTGVRSGDWEATAAPEVRQHGLAAAGIPSDVYSLCASLSTLFHERGDAESQAALGVLQDGLIEDPTERHTLEGLETAFSEMLGESLPPPATPPARFWTEEQVVPFRGHDYRIVARLGSGGVGVTFKVVEIDRSTKEELGTYVAKVARSGEVGASVRKSYNLVRSHLGRDPGVSAIFEVAEEWSENEFIALMTWIEGAPLADYIGVFPLLAEDQQERSAEQLALRWIGDICEALRVLHRNGLIHGDVSPRNIICSAGNVVLTDYDFVGKIGEPISCAGTVLYSSPSYQEKRPASPSDDIYALAASFFHVVFEREPFRHAGSQTKKLGLNWEDCGREDYPIVAGFLDRATDPDPEKRFASASEALDALCPSRPPVKEAESVQETAPVDTDALLPDRQPATEPSELLENRVDWLLSLLQSYPGSRWGNRETRGLDTEFAAQTYVETNLEETLLQDISSRRVRLVILCGNAGDGKTALLQHSASRLGLGNHSSSERILEGCLEDGLTVRMNLDGSAAWQERSADEILDDFLSPFQQGAPDHDITHLLAINDGRLLEWIERIEATPLAEELYDLLQEEAPPVGSHIRFESLNERSLVGGVTSDHKEIETSFPERLLDQLYGGEAASEIWEPCVTCCSRERCDVFRTLEVFGPKCITKGAPDAIRKRARERLFEALQAVHLRGEVHITMRELRAALVYVLFGVSFCSDYHGEEDTPSLSYWNRAFDPASPRRQGEVLRELARFDPALEAHPQIDRRLLCEPTPDRERTAPHYGPPLDSARRRAYFEWTRDHIEEVSSDPESLGLAGGRHLRLFRDLPLDNEQMDSTGRADVCARLCRGISRLEDLPPRAFAGPDNMVPLRITPRTPTETAFWVEKPLERFRLEADLPGEASGVDRLHRQALLIFQYRDGREERLRLGAELFHLLLELCDGYQLGDVSTDDAFAHLSIFAQRLLREDDNQLLAWCPMQDALDFRIATKIEQRSQGTVQQIVLQQRELGDQR